MSRMFNFMRPSMRRSLLLATLLPVLCGCFPRDQFWQKPDIGQKHTNLTEAAASAAPVRFGQGATAAWLR